MKKIKYFLIGAIILGVINFSCKKDSKSETTTVEYNVTPVDWNIGNVIFIDSTGKDVTVPVPLNGGPFGLFVSGSHTIHILKKPFKAKLTVDFFNSDNVTHGYILSIDVNGKEVKQLPCTVAVSESVEYSIDYTIQ